MQFSARWALAAVAVLPLGACNPNPSLPVASTVPLPQPPPTVSAQDQSFVQQAIGSDIFEIKSSELALQRSRNPRTREFAQRMINDHTRSSEQLRAIAQANNILLPTGMGPEQERAFVAISNTRRIFDNEYFRQQAFAHQTAIRVYETEVNGGYNPQLRQFAQQTLPMLQEHLQLAEQGRDAIPLGRTPARRSF